MYSSCGFSLASQCEIIRRLHELAHAQSVMRHHRFIAFGLLALFVSSLAIGAQGALENVTYEEGYIDWEMDIEQRLYVEGENAETSVLQRARPDATLGFTDVNPGGGPVEIFQLTSPPLANPMKGTINMSTYFSAYIVPIAAAINPQWCTSNIVTSPPGDDDTTALTMSVSISGTQVYETTVTEEIGKIASNDPQNFSGEIIQLDVDLQAGDSFTLSLVAQHNCEGSRARIQWGGFETNAGGIIMTGKVYEPEASIRIDSSKRAHIEFLPTLPWGEDDVLIDGNGNRAVSWVLRGPLDSDEKTNKDRDAVMENSIGRIRMERNLGDNETAWIWTGKEQLFTGSSNLEVCVKTTSGNPNVDCHAFGIIRFDVEASNDGFATAGVWLTLTTIFCFFGLVYKGFNSDPPLPLPIIGALFVMMLLMLPLGFAQTNLSDEAILDENALLVDAELKVDGTEFITLSELMGDSNALVIGAIAPGSESAQDQANEFALLLLQRDDISVVQVVTGESSLLSDVLSYRSQLNVSWEIVLDYNNELVGSSPTGNADSILIVDKTMHVTWSETPTAGSKAMNDAVDGIGSGGPTTLGTYFSILIPAGLFLVFLALPRQGWTKPEEPLPPGALWASIVVAGGCGVLMVHLPALLASVLPIGAFISHIIHVAMFLWFIQMCILTFRTGAPTEAKLLGSILHSLTNKSFQEWRPREDMQRDVFLGVFIGWFSWLADPLIAQGVGATALNGGLSILFAILILIGHILVSGLTVLILRVVASWGGSISNLFGKFGADSFARFMGLVLIPISIWVTINSILALLSIGIF